MSDDDCKALVLKVAECAKASEDFAIFVIECEYGAMADETQAGNLEDLADELPTWVADPAKQCVRWRGRQELPTWMEDFTRIRSLLGGDCAKLEEALVAGGGLPTLVGD